MMPYRSTVQEKPHANMHVLCTSWVDLELRVHGQLGRIMQAVECGHVRASTRHNHDGATISQLQCQEMRISSLFTLTQQIMAQVEMDAVRKCAQMADPDAVKIEERLDIATERAAESAAAKLDGRIDERIDERMTERMHPGDETLKKLDDRIRLLSSEMDDVKLEIKMHEG